MCVTHLPQVAGCGHHHFFVCKETDGEMTETHMHPLDKRARLQELARLLGGSEVTRNTWQTRKSCLPPKLFDFHRVIVNSKLPIDLQPKVPNRAKVYYHRHITDEPRTARAQKGIKSLCAVKC